MTPQETAQIASKIMLETTKMHGYFYISYYTGDITVIGIDMPSGICYCDRNDGDKYVQFDCEFDSFSEYHQRAILFEVGDRYCSTQNTSNHE